MYLSSYLVFAGVSSFAAIMASNSILELRRSVKNQRLGKMLVCWCAIMEAFACVWAPAQLALASMEFTHPSTGDTVHASINYGYSILALTAAFVSFAFGLEVGTWDRYFGKRLKRMISMIRADIAKVHFRGGQLTTTIVSMAALFTDLRYIAVASVCRAVGCILCLGCLVVSIQLHGELHLRTGMVVLGCILIMLAAFIVSWVSFRVYQWRYKDRWIQVTYYVLVIALGVCIGCLFSNMITFHLFSTAPSNNHNSMEGFRLYALVMVGVGILMATISEHLILSRHRMAMASVVRDIDELHCILRSLISEEGIIPQAQAMSVQRIDLYRMERYLITSRRLINKWTSNMPIKFDFTVTPESEHLGDTCEVGDCYHYHHANSASDAHSSPVPPAAQNRKGDSVVSNKSKVSSKGTSLLPQALSSDSPLPKAGEHSPIREMSPHQSKVSGDVVTPFPVSATGELHEAVVAPLETVLLMPRGGGSLAATINTNLKGSADVLLSGPMPPLVQGNDFMDLETDRHNSEIDASMTDPLAALTGDVDGLFKESAPFLGDLVHPPEEQDGARDDPISSALSDSTASDVRRALCHDYSDGDLLLVSGLQLPPTHQPIADTTSNSQAGAIPWHNETRQRSMQSIQSVPRLFEGHMGTTGRKVLPVQEEESSRLAGDQVDPGESLKQLGDIKDDDQLQDLV